MISSYGKADDNLAAYAGLREELEGIKGKPPNGSARIRIIDVSEFHKHTPVKKS
jgi:hypothetical protein